MKSWKKFKENLYHSPKLGLWIDSSKMDFAADFFTTTEPAMQKAFAGMADLEAGAIANPDEKRMVGHYWLRSAKLAPTPRLADEIEETIGKIKAFTADIHSGAITAPNGKPFKKLLLVGIGGSALGPQFVADALGGKNDAMQPFFLDNTDPDGMERVFNQIGDLSDCLIIVISKSGSTKETRNGMLEAKVAWQRAGLDFARQAVAVTGEASQLDELAITENWLARFPMWDWVGGRTSVTSAVGLLPAALQGIDITELLSGAALADSITRNNDTRNNPAALLALSWLHGSRGCGLRDMVMLPYKDRLLLFSRYLQQLIMESLGKDRTLDGKQVAQGLTVYGNKGSTDQHAYVQQLRDGVHNFFVTFIEVLHDRDGVKMEVEPGITSGDYLFGFLYGTRQALAEKGRESITITVEKLNPATIGALIAIFERAVGLYALLVNINAYHQPGVEAGKKAATAILELQKQVHGYLAENPQQDDAYQVAKALEQEEQAELVFAIMRRMQGNS